MDFERAQRAFAKLSSERVREIYELGWRDRSRALKMITEYQQQLTAAARKMRVDAAVIGIRGHETYIRHARLMSGLARIKVNEAKRKGRDAEKDKDPMTEEELVRAFTKGMKATVTEVAMTMLFCLDCDLTP